jgi:ATP-dependent helicase YprA (DUF1998 family)
VALGCPCSAGCPACVGPPGEVGPAGKETALRILEHLVSGPVPEALSTDEGTLSLALAAAP